MDYETEAWWSGNVPETERTNTPSENSLEGDLEGGWFSPSSVQAQLLEKINQQLHAFGYTSSSE